MSTFWKIGVVGALIVLVLVVVVLKAEQTSRDTGNRESTGFPADPSTSSSDASPPAESRPRLVDLGRNTCIPCKAMAPILEEMKREYAGVLDVVVIDVSKDTAAAGKYGIRLIPTQVFYDASGEEIDRHEGFISKTDILATFRKHGVAIGSPQ